MQALIAVEGREPDAYFAQIAELLPRSVSCVVVHVVDERPHKEIEMVERRTLLRRNLPSERVDRMQSAEREAAQRVLDRAQRILAREGFTNALVGQIIMRGRPEGEIVRVADDRGVALVIVCGRRERHPGPKSIGKVARFGLDHVNCDVMLIRPQR